MESGGKFLSMKQIAEIVDGEWLVYPEDENEVIKNYAVYVGELLQEKDANLFFAMDGPTWVKGTGNGGMYAKSLIDTHSKVKGIEGLLKMVIVQRRIPDVHVPQLMVENPYKAMNSLFLLVNKHNISKNIGITGTVGKSTVKDLLADLLSQTNSTHKTPTNHNSRTCTKVSILNNGSAMYNVLEIAVSALWYGKDKVGVVHDVPLDLAILTQVGVGQRGYDAHQMADFKTRIAYGLNQGRPFLINGDIDNIEDVIELSRRYTTHVLTYGFSSRCDFRAKISEDNQVTVIYEGQQLIKANGRNFDRGLLSNMVGVVAAYHILGGRFDDSLISYFENSCKKKAKYDVRKTIVNGHQLTIVDDTHNAELLSMENFINYAENFHAGSNDLKIFIAGRIVNLKDKEINVYAKLAKELNSSGLNQIYTFGDDVEFLDANMDDKVFNGHFDDIGSLIRSVVTRTNQNTIMFIKGSSRNSQINLISSRVFRDAQYYFEGGNEFAMTKINSNNLSYTRNGAGRLLVVLNCLQKLASQEIKLTDKIKINRTLSKDPSVNKVGLILGEQLSVLELLSVAIVSPAPDVIINLAESIYGGIGEAQIHLATEAKQLGLSDQAVANITGRPTRKPQRMYLSDLEKIGEAFVDLPNECFSLLGLENGQLRHNGKLYQKQSNFIESGAVSGSLFFGGQERNGLLFFNDSNGKSFCAFVNSPRNNYVNDLVDFDCVNKVKNQL